MICSSDVASIDRLADRKQDENWRFRAFLKEECDLPDTEVDRMVQELYNQEAGKFDCTTCARCCSTTPLLDDEDVERLAGSLGITSDEVTSRYLKMDDDWGELTFNQKPCPLLNDKLCTCYAARPYDCWSYPHLQKEGFRHRLISTVNNASVCPVVFNVLERLKDAMRPHGWNRHTSGRGRNR